MRTPIGCLMPNNSESANPLESAPANHKPCAAWLDGWLNGWLNGWQGLTLLIVVQALAFAVCAYKTDGINPDGVAYQRLGLYYHHAQWDLAVSGYWSPLLSWLIAAALYLTPNLETAGQVALGLSSVVFTLGSFALYRRMPIPCVPVNLLTAMSMFFAIDSCMFKINTDILMCGLLFLAVAQLIGPNWSQSLRACVLAGVLIGVAYLGKAVALPLGVMIAFSLALLRVAIHDIGFAAAAKRAMLTLLFAVLTSAPWICIISLKYHKPTIGTSGAIAHALVGPNAEPRFRHVVSRVVLPPEPGRITWWEDPSNMAYEYWSPLASAANAKHQAWVIGSNLWNLPSLLALLDFLLLGVTGAILAFVFARPWRATLREQTWRWAAIPLLCNVLIYLPMYAPTSRYYFHCFPYLAIAAIGWIRWLIEPATNGQRKTLPLALTATGLAAALAINWFGLKSDSGGHKHFWLFVLPYVGFLALAAAMKWIGGARVSARWWTMLAVAVAFCSLAGGNLGHVVSVVKGGRYADARSRQLARRLTAARISGPVAATPGDGNDGMYVGFFLDQPFYGNTTDPEHSTDTLYHSGAKLIIALRDAHDDPTTQRLLDDPRFENLDPQLFAKDPAEAEKLPLMAFAVRTPVEQTGEQPAQKPSQQPAVAPAE